MSELKRYVAEIDFYIYAENDEDAIKQAKEMARQIDLKEDNKASVIALNEVPFASLGNPRKIKI